MDNDGGFSETSVEDERSALDPRSRLMVEFLRTPLMQVVIWLTGLAVCVAVGAYIVAKFRDRAVGSAPPTEDLLTTFREMRQQGDLSEAEFRTIKTKLGATLQGPVNDRSEKGYERSG